MVEELFAREYDPWLAHKALKKRELFKSERDFCAIFSYDTR